MTVLPQNWVSVTMVHTYHIKGKIYRACVPECVDTKLKHGRWRLKISIVWIGWSVWWHEIAWSAAWDGLYNRGYIWRDFIWSIYIYTSYTSYGYIYIYTYMYKYNVVAWRWQWNNSQWDSPILFSKIDQYLNFQSMLTNFWVNQYSFSIAPLNRNVEILWTKHGSFTIGLSSHVCDPTCPAQSTNSSLGTEQVVSSDSSAVTGIYITNVHWQVRIRSDLWVRFGFLWVHMAPDDKNCSVEVRIRKRKKKCGMSSETPSFRPLDHSQSIRTALVRAGQAYMVATTDGTPALLRAFMNDIIQYVTGVQACQQPAYMLYHMAAYGHLFIYLIWSIYTWIYICPYTYMDIHIYICIYIYICLYIPITYLAHFTIASGANTNNCEAPRI